MRSFSKSVAALSKAEKVLFEGFGDTGRGLSAVQGAQVIADSLGKILADAQRKAAALSGIAKLAQGGQGLASNAYEVRESIEAAVKALGRVAKAIEAAR